MSCHGNAFEAEIEHVHCDENLRGILMVYYDSSYLVFNLNLVRLLLVFSFFAFFSLPCLLCCFDHSLTLDSCDDALLKVSLRPLLNFSGK